MRVGQNPAKFADKVAQPAKITITIVNCIPMLSGYHEQSLDVLKACLQSIWDHTSLPYDLMVFDNHSCPDVRGFLVDALKRDLIQYLVLSDKNIGKLGAWNFMFGAAPGETIVFADADVFFGPGWLEGSLELFDAFPNVGMVTARPVRSLESLSSRTFNWARQQEAGVLQEGQLMTWETFWDHGASLGWSEEEGRRNYASSRDYLLTLNGKKAYIGAEHFQFAARREILQKVLPVPSEKPMRGERALDSAINELGCLRLNTVETYVRHMGNRVESGNALQKPLPDRRRNLLRKIIWLPGIRHVLLWLYNRIFHLYFYHVE